MEHWGHYWCSSLSPFLCPLGADSELLPWLLPAEVLPDCVCLPGGLWLHPPGGVPQKQQRHLRWQHHRPLPSYTHGQVPEVTVLHLFLFDRKWPWTVVINMSGCVTPVWSCNSWWMNAWFCRAEPRRLIEVYFIFFNHPTFSLLDKFWDMFNHKIFILASNLSQFFPFVILNCCVLMVEFNTFQCFFCHQYPALLYAGAACLGES